MRERERERKRKREKERKREKRERKERRRGERRTRKREKKGVERIFVRLKGPRLPVNIPTMIDNTHRRDGIPKNASRRTGRC